ncbi:MAG TPA: sulfide/dihydroorotate dehydrogenase-like FAD/NAD-binding protein [Feifaniaceae bacterium]|nr:sulfide/dihydroorotate dehydrogenase-like FAD/NAD-binding protein [Feifaniaceae bacterium]
MYQIVRKRPLHETVTLLEVLAPKVAKKALPGQFIILRVDESGERIPLTIAGYDREKGTVTIIFQKVGATTNKLDALNEGEYILDFVGPLGKPSEFEGLEGKKVAVIGGGLGIAIAYPQAKALHEIGADVDIIVGFRNTSLFILVDELQNACTNLYIMTDDGSNGHKGFTTTALEDQIKAGVQYDLVIAIGPLPMMRAVSNITKQYGIRTIVSMNPVMVDGTGMCGGCRVTVGGETKFACVDGPDFDAHQVDFDEAIQRSRMYKPQETESMERHICRLTGEEVK